MEHTYSVECLPSHEKSELKKTLVDLCSKSASGKVRYEFAMVKFSVVRKLS